MLSSFFGPKWRHRDPKVRLVALRQLATDDPVLLERVMVDEDASVRREILARITDFDCLQAVMREDGDQDVCQCADQRFRKLLCGLSEQSPSIETRLRFLHKLNEIALFEHLVRHAREPELRQRALEKIDRQGLLAQIALEDEVGAMRLAALQRVHQESTLQRIAREARRRDKRVARLARERLDEIAAQRQGPEERQAIIDKLGRLADQGGMDLAAAQKLHEAWLQWQNQATPAEQQAYGDARSAFEKASEGYRQEKNIRHERLALCERAEQVLQDLAARESLAAEDESTLQAMLVMMQSAWDDIHSAATRAGMPDTVLEERFNKAIADSAGRAQDLHTLRGQIAYFGELIDAMQHLQDTDNGVSRRDIDELKQRWTNAPRLLGDSTAARFASLDEQFSSALGRAEKRLLEGRNRKAELRERIGSLFVALRSALEEGQLNSARGRFDQIRQDVAELRKFDRQAASDFEKQLRVQGAQLHEMQNWRHYGSHRVREELIQRAQQLAESGAAVDVLAQAVPALRQEWKALNRSGSRASDAEWAQFDEACTRAYQTVKEQRDMRKRQQEESLRQRETLCAEVEHFAAQWQQDSTDWKAMEKLVMHAKRLWREAGPVEHSAYKPVHERFTRALAVFEQPLAAERAANWQMREALLSQVELLVDEADLAEAIRQAKQLQSRWKVTVQSPRNREQALWQRFRSAMDAVFARREQARQVQEEEHKQLLTTKSGIVSKVEALASTAFHDLKSARQALAELESAFDDLAPLKQDQSLRQVFVNTRQALLDTEKQEVALLKEEALTHLREKARICEAMEALAEQRNSAAKDPLVARWQSLSKLEDVDLETRLQARFTMAQTALEHATGYPSELLDGNLACKQDLILRMEILQEVASPADYAEQRMALKVAMLSESMGQAQDVAPASQQWNALQTEWLLCGPVPSVATEELNRRYQSCID